MAESSVLKKQEQAKKVHHKLDQLHKPDLDKILFKVMRYSLIILIIV